jgi:hypothetical protein
MNLKTRKCLIIKKRILRFMERITVHCETRLACLPALLASSGGVPAPWWVERRDAVGTRSRDGCATMPKACLPPGTVGEFRGRPRPVVGRTARRRRDPQPRRLRYDAKGLLASRYCWRVQGASPPHWVGRTARRRRDPQPRRLETAALRCQRLAYLAALLNRSVVQHVRTD